MESLRKKPTRQPIEPDRPQLEKARCIDPLFIRGCDRAGEMSGNFRENSQEKAQDMLIAHTSQQAEGSSLWNIIKSS